MTIVEAVVGLGSNLGDRVGELRHALERMQDLGSVVAVSSLYETAPIGGPEQGPYLNAVAVLETQMTPRALLDGLLAIEHDAGRLRRVRWGPRSIDLDLLLYARARVDEPGLRVPHPRLVERRFVLEPLLEVRPEAVLPDGTRLAGLVAAVSDQEATRIEMPGWPVP